MERPTTAERPLIEIRELYEIQRPVELLAMKAVHLARMSEHERHVHIINDVLDGYGNVHALDMPVYDANDGTVGPAEHPEDDFWPHIQIGEK